MKMTINEYRAKEDAFAEAQGALCENVSPLLCNCSICPLKAMCDELCNAEIVKEN